MAERVEAIVKPELLIWARKSIGLDLTLAAKRAGTTEERLLNWEEGKQRPTISQLRRMGDVYKRPIAAFYLPAPPKSFNLIKDFRQISEKQVHEYSPTLLYEIRRAYSRRESAIELYKDVEGIMPPIALPKKTSGNVEKLGQTIREFLGVSYERQRQWKTDRESFNGWRLAIESKNILVFQASRIRVDEMRGFSIGKTPFPVIVVNIQDTLVARTFTLLHEFAHLTMGKEGICDLTGHADLEVSGNAIAAATLVPKKSFLAEPEFQNKKASGWSDNGISKLASRYKVSREVILHRLHTMDSISSKFYKNKSAQYREERAEQMQKVKQKKTGFAPPDRMVVSSCGKLYSRLVLNSYRNEKITASDASDLLAVKIKYFPKIEMAIFG